MSSKRTHAEMEDRDSHAVPSPFLPMFEHFRSELDEHHDRRERVVKASRDITAASKKIIFTLQRVRNLKGALPQHVNKSNHQYYESIQKTFASISGDLQDLNAYRYSRQISGGCQEYIEAASFQHYLETAKLLPYDEAVWRMSELDLAGPGVSLSHEDYVLGVYDMTGELMRFTITAMATSGALPSIAEAGNVPTAIVGPQRNALTDMRALRSALEGLDSGVGPFASEISKKAEVMRTSVEKVEKALYGLVVRGAERPKGWMPDAGESGVGVPVEVESQA